MDTALGYLLGSEQKVAVEGAEHADEETPTSGAAEAVAVQEWLRTWADKELLTFRVQQAERAAVFLGDSVMGCPTGSRDQPQHKTALPQP
ncbi:hypothetical protein [Streptomyces sp. STR69]|uniref:hypothetical protein n=1 Tax=Streptomyces sp. STR69 TaxID=1796942 RepID=UPI0021C96B72|nr:hypothetical protein [Streptomyces sp. STR69]